MAQKKSYKKKQFKNSDATGRHTDGSAVRAKKHLGQHFLKDEAIAKKIGDTLTCNGYKNVVEIGPGMGMLTKYILQNDIHLAAMELDRESVAFLKQQFPLEHPEVMERNSQLKVIEGDFLKFDLTTLFDGEPYAITGNFPYNISTQIVFKMLEHKDQIPELTGMFQKEVAQRICGSSGNKTYGILSVLTQAFYDAEYLFTVDPHVFDPPPKVDSGVIRLIRKEKSLLNCDQKEFFKVVKTAFGQRRKTLRNSLKVYELDDATRELEIFSKRPEQLEVKDFVTLTKLIHQR